MNDDLIKLVFVVDKNFVKFLVVCIYSIIVNTKSNLRIYVICDDESFIWNEMQKLLQVKDFDLITINYNHYKNKQYVNSINQKSSAHFAKFDIPNLVAENRVLYLDCDIIVVNDIKSLWDEFDNNYSIQAAVNPFYNKDNGIMELTANDKKFNSGVLLMNLDRMRMNHSTDKLYEFKKKTAGQSKLNDQPAFNYIFKHDWCELPPNYNYISIYFRRHFSIFGFSKDEYDRILKNITIVHFTGTDKPWSFLSLHPYNKLYREYYAKCYGPIKFNDKNIKGYFIRTRRKIKAMISYYKKIHI
jgi:lipopolysaccharide biosynthesis glycosyltransferase